MPLGYSANQGNKRGKTIMIVPFIPLFTTAIRCGNISFTSCLSEQVDDEWGLACVGSASRGSEAARSRRLSPLIFLCVSWWVKTLDRPRGEKIPQPWFSPWLPVCGGGGVSVREEEEGAAVPAAPGEEEDWGVAWRRRSAQLWT
jgi:hypothetical protein